MGEFALFSIGFPKFINPERGEKGKLDPYIK
jgi:hypothetical protein